MNLIEILYNWAYACGMGLVTALVVIGIPAVIGTLMETNKKKKDLLKVQADRAKDLLAEQAQK